MIATGRHRADQLGKYQAKQLYVSDVYLFGLLVQPDLAWHFETSGWRPMPNPVQSSRFMSLLMSTGFTR